MFLGFFHCLPSLSIVPFILLFLVFSCLAVTIHSTYSFLLVKESVLKKSDSFLFFFSVADRSPGRVTSFICGFTHLNISLSGAGLASFFLSASVFARKPNTDH